MSLTLHGHRRHNKTPEPTTKPSRGRLLPEPLTRALLASIEREAPARRTEIGAVAV